MSENKVSFTTGCILLPLALVAVSLYRVGAYTVLWGWLAPRFGFPVYGIGTIGLAAMFWGLWVYRSKQTGKDNETPEENDKKAWKHIGEQVWVTSFALALGWAFKAWGAA